MRASMQNGVEHWQQTLENASPQRVLEEMVAEFGERMAVVTSFQVTGIVTLHMLQHIAPNTPVFTLDTGLLFPETYTLIDELETIWNLNLTRVRPELSVMEQDEAYGRELWRYNPDGCCYMRKVVPLRDVLHRHEAWVSGIRRDQSASREHTPVVQWDERNRMVKISPFATWTQEMIWTYIDAHKLPYNALYDRGYPSIGCLPCTTPATNNNPRSGRWQHHNRTECGIHGHG